MKLSVTFILIVMFYRCPSSNLQELDTAENKKSFPSEMPADAEANNEKGKCQCGVFGTKTPKPEEKPLVSKSLIDVQCNEDGRKQCLDLCVALARAARENAAVSLCETIDHADKLQPSVFTKICEETVYTYSGLTSPNVFCCHEYKPLDCEWVEDTINE